MKILAVTHFFASHRGGIEIVAEQLNCALTRMRPSEIVWAASDDSLPPENFPGRCVSLECSNIVERRLGIPWPIPSSKALRTILRLVSGTDLVLLHDALYPTSIAAFLFAQHRRKRVVIVQHIGHVPYRNVVLRTAMTIANRCIAVPMLSRADRVVFISGLTANYFSRRCAYRNPPTVIFNGISETMVEAAARISQSRPLDSNAKKTVAFVGRFVEKKGLSVMEHLARALPEVNFVLAGWGTIRPEDWSVDNVRVFRNMANAGITEIYRSAELLVLPSVGEGFPLVIQEALCCGVPVLCGEEILQADPWLKGRIEVAPVDLAKPADTANVWADRITDLLSGRREMARADAGDASKRYAWRHIAADYWALFDEISINKPALAA